MKIYFTLIATLIFISYHAAAKPDAGRAACKKIENTIDDYAKNKTYTAFSINKLYQQFRKNPRCDDGWYAEGLTELIVKTTAYDFEAVVKKVSSDKDMLIFVKRHINATADWDDLDKIVINAAKDCPKGFATKCEELRIISANASKEAHEAASPK